MRSQRTITPPPSAAIQKLLLSDIELAHYYGISVATLRKWRILGIGPKWIKVGSLVRYRIDDAQAYLESRPSGGGAAA
jgi:hypothetical protein